MVDLDELSDMHNEMSFNPDIINRISANWEEEIHPSFRQDTTLCEVYASYHPPEEVCISGFGKIKIKQQKRQPVFVNLHQTPAHLH